MEQGMHLLCIGVSAMVFAVFMTIWIHSDRQLSDTMVRLERNMNEERVVSVAKGD